MIVLLKWSRYCRSLKRRFYDVDEIYKEIITRKISYVIVERTLHIKLKHMDLFLKCLAHKLDFYRICLNVIN